jgi:hypothetical protein
MDADIILPPTNIIDEGEQILILPSDSIQSSVVLDQAKLPIFLLDEDDWSS